MTDHEFDVMCRQMEANWMNRDWPVEMSAAVQRGDTEWIAWWLHETERAKELERQEESDALLEARILNYQPTENGA